MDDLEIDVPVYGVVYMTTNNINGKIYIGKTIHAGIKLEKYFGSGTQLKRSFKKYGKENFSKIILEECYSKEDLNNREIYWIDFYNSRDRNIGYNIAAGGDGGDPEVFNKLWKNPDFRNMMNNYLKERWDDPEFRKMMSDISKEYSNRPEVKQRVSEETTERWKDSDHRNFMKKITTDRWDDPEFRKMMSDISKEYNNRPEVKDKFYDILKEQWDDPEFRKMMSTSMIEKWKDPEFRNMMSNTSKEYNNRPEVKERVSNRAKEMWKDPEFRNMMSKRMTEYYSIPENREISSLRSIEYYSIPENRESFKKLMKERCNTQEFRNKISETSKIAWKDPNHREIKKRIQNSPEYIENQRLKNGIPFTAINRETNSIIEFLSIKEASDKLNINRKTIRAILDNKRRDDFCKDWTFKLKEDSVTDDK